MLLEDLEDAERRALVAKRTKDVVVWGLAPVDAPALVAYGERLYVARVSAGIRQREAATLANCSHVTYIRIERGLIPYTDDSTEAGRAQRRLGKRLGVEPDDLDITQNLGELANDLEA